MTRAIVKQQGFTLLEVLIALALMALLSIISWQALDLVERSTERLNANTDDTLALVRVLGQIGSDLSRYADNDILPAPAAVNSSEAAGTMLPAGIAWAEPVLTVVRSVHDGAWQQVAWGKDGAVLRRAVGAAARVLPLPRLETGDVVLDHVQSFRIRAWIPGQGWLAINSNGIQPAATGLEIVIERQYKGVTEAYRKVVLLP